MWAEESKGPRPSVHWDHDNREAYKDGLSSTMKAELALFKNELDAVYQNIRDADRGPELIALPVEQVFEESLLSQLGAHPKLTWLENSDAAGAFDALRLVGAVGGGQDDQAATLEFREMLTYDKEVQSGAPFWRNIYRRWLHAYGKMADS